MEAPLSPFKKYQVSELKEEQSRPWSFHRVQMRPFWCRFHILWCWTLRCRHHSLGFGAVSGSAVALRPIEAWNVVGKISYLRPDFAATTFCLMCFCWRPLEVDRLSRQLKMDWRCMVEDYEILGVICGSDHLGAPTQTSTSSPWC